MLNPVSFNTVSYYRPLVKRPQAQPSFGSIGQVIAKFPKEKFLKMTDIVSSELPVDYNEFQFLLRNPVGYYLECGKEVNKFLRSGTFKPLPDINEVDPIFKNYLLKQIAQKKAFNRTIIESIDYIDALLTSQTTRPMVVYRDAPASWMETAQNGILADKGFLSTSTVRGASLEGVIENGADNMTYVIHVPAGVKYLDLTNTQEKEMLFGRNKQFEILSPGVLRLLK